MTVHQNLIGGMIMKLLNKIACLVIAVLLLGAAVVVLRAAWTEQGRGSIRALAEPGRLNGTCIAVGLVSLTALLVLTGLPRRRREQFRSFDDEGGTVSISTAAISDYIMKLSSPSSNENITAP